MKLLFKDCHFYRHGGLQTVDVLSLNVGMGSVAKKTSAAEPFLQFQNAYIFPGFADVHVHFREPGFSYKETVASGSRAAAHGGYTQVCTMPNLLPVPDTPEHLAIQQTRIKQDACIRVTPYGAITVGQKGTVLSDMEALAPSVVAFSDDGRGVQNADLMEQAMREAKRLRKIIVAHCEDDALRGKGYIHDGTYAKAHGHLGISSESEWLPLKRDLDLVRKTGCAYHVCHVSAKESVELIRNAKKEGLDVTCETAPHYLLLDETDLQEDGRFKMNPPLRSPADREALLEGISDGTIDMIATDHAPHSVEEKSKGLRDSLMGIVGLETAFPSLYTKLVKTGILSLPSLIALLSDRPRERFGLPLGNDFSVWNLDVADSVRPEEFYSLGHATPFQDHVFFGKNQLTVFDGSLVYLAQENA